MAFKILFITLSNIGDVILTLPALDYLKENFPESKITVMVGPRPKEIFADNPLVDKLIIYDKHAKIREKIQLFDELKKEKFDIIVDLRNSLFGAFLPARYKTSPFLAIPRSIKHMRDRHLFKVQSSILRLRSGLMVSGVEPSKFKVESEIQKNSLFISPQDEAYVNALFRENNITKKDTIIAVAPGARSHIKRWPKEKFMELISRIRKECAAKIFLVGDKDDAPVTGYVAEHCQGPLINLTGKTTIAQLACLLKKAHLLLTNDSAVLHIAGYVNTSTVAIFGPTNELKYGPWSARDAVVKKEVFCRPCTKALCAFGHLHCMHFIKVEDVLSPIKRLLIETDDATTGTTQKKDFKRILIVRTDRIGDVLLSTPVVKTLRDAYPYAYIAMMVSPYAKDCVEGNPYLDEVIIYDKDGKHKKWRRSMKFAQRLRKKGFDLALILHPTNRVHMLTFFSGIPRRIGYNRKLAFLLTDRIQHAKQRGEKHETEYALDVLRYLGVEAAGKNIFMPIRPESERWVEALFESEGITNADRLLAVHPGASCPSKVWLPERFAQVADKLIEKYGLKVLVIAGPKDSGLADNTMRHMHNPAVNLAGRVSVSQLASILGRCQLFISNDSGPVHIASAVGTPVISIFGRNQKGLSPRRWGPLGARDKVIHKEVGCVTCLAHNCDKDFACLKAISVDDVLGVAEELLSE